MKKNGVRRTDDLAGGVPVLNVPNRRNRWLDARRYGSCSRVLARHSVYCLEGRRREGGKPGKLHVQGSISFIANVGSALLWSLLASFSADVSCRSFDLSDL